MVLCAMTSGSVAWLPSTLLGMWVHWNSRALSLPPKQDLHAQ